MNNEKRQLVAEVIDSSPITNGIYYESLEKEIALFLYEKGLAMSLTEIYEKLKENKIYISKKELHRILLGMKNKYISDTSTENIIILLPSAKHDISEKYQKYHEVLSNVIEAYFSSGVLLPKENVRQWLEELLLAIFERYFSDVLKRVRFKEKNEDYGFNVDDAHRSILSKFDAEKDDEEILSIQFRKMLDSDDPDVLYLLNYYIRLSYSSQVLTTKMYASESIAEAFQDKTILLDTNVLIALQLEKANNYKVNLKAINDVCTKENIKLHYLPITQAEYKRVVEAKKQEYAELYSGFSLKVMDERMRSNNIVHALRKSTCVTSADVMAFFDKYLINLPERVDDANSVEIAVLSDGIWKEIYNLEAQNEEAKSAFRRIYVDNHKDDYEDEDVWNESRASENDVHIKKSDRVVEHDLSLIGYVRAIRGESDYGKQVCGHKNDNILILTMDSSLIKYVNTAFPAEDFVYGMRDIITLLSLNRGGVLGEKSVYVPLLRSFITNNFIIWGDSYDVKDLSLILNVENQIGTLNETKVRQIAREIRKMRLSGERYQIHPYLMKELNFEYSELNREKEALASKYSTQSARLEDMEMKLSMAQQDNMQLRKNEFDRQYENEYKKRSRKYRWMVFLKYLFIFLAIVGIVASVFFLLIYSGVLESECTWVKKTQNLAFSSLFSIINILVDWLGLKDFRNKVQGGYYEEVNIKEYVLKSMKVDLDVEEYIRKGWTVK